MLRAEPKRQILIIGGRGEVGDRGPWSPLTSRRSAVRRDRAGEERAQHLDGSSFSDQRTAQTQKTHLEPRWQLLGHPLTPKPEPRVPQPDRAPSSGHLSGGLGTPSHRGDHSFFPQIAGDPAADSRAHRGTEDVPVSAHSGRMGVCEIEGAGFQGVGSRPVSWIHTWVAQRAESIRPFLSRMGPVPRRRPGERT